MTNIKLLINIALLYLLMPSNCHAMTLDRAYIENFAKSYIEDNFATPVNGKMEVSVSSIDPRISIKPCTSPLQANIPEKNNGRNVNLKISCADSTSWQIYLPVRIKTKLPVVVASTPISKGSVLDSSNLNIEYRDKLKLRGEIINNIDLIAGARAKRNIVQGRVVNRRNICLVCKGESVTIIAKADNLVIKASGLALRDGAIGEQISVRNKRSGKTVLARVEALNKVVINL